MTENLSAPPQKPFGRIALSLSGGGYRAAAFHLGVLHTLHHLNLLKDVRTLSTVSGGTFTGVRYAMSLKRCQTFSAFYSDLRSDLESVDLPKLAFEKLAHGKPSIPSGRWDLITAFAQVYDEKLFNGERFEMLWNGAATHLTDIVFNSTEFRTAVAFRFRKSENPRTKIGNGNVSINADQAKQIRLADIVAASSCFPGGFEPLNFPNDFHWSDTLQGKTALASLQKKEWAPLPLMDGGIYDNQGIGSLILDALKPPGRAAKGEHQTNGGDNLSPEESLQQEEFGLFIFSDTDPRRSCLYTLPQPPKLGWLRIWHLNLLWWILFVLATMSGGVSIARVKITAFPGHIEFVPPLFSFCVVWALLWFRIKIKSALNAIPRLGLDAWRLAKGLKLNQLIYMIQLRVSSLFALASNIFMRRIRRLIYEAAYSDPRVGGRLMPNTIDFLLATTLRPEPLAWMNPSERTLDVVRAAQTIPTTLWFTDLQQLKDLIAAGQITVCRKILDHVLETFGGDPDVIMEPQKELYDRAVQHFNTLNADPYTFV